MCVCVCVCVYVYCSLPQSSLAVFQHLYLTILPWALVAYVRIVNHVVFRQ